MPEPSQRPNISRRQTLTGIGLAGAALAQAAAAQEGPPPADGRLLRHLTTAAMVADAGAQAGDWVETLGFHTPGDGGAALYHIQAAAEELPANGADVLALANGLIAVLVEETAVNYRMFGARSDQQSDDGVAIKLAHEYANRHGVPVINRSGEFWITETNSIPIQTPVQWGKTIFHIDERFNTRGAARFYVRNDEPTVDLTGDETIRAALLEKLKPGVQIIGELAPYSNHLFMVQDADDRIGIRAGYEGNKGWAREELFYVEEEGRILGDIAWDFNAFTSIRAVPCPRNYLVIEGGGFLFSGDSPENSRPGYHQLGINIQRSRTLVREQWMGLEPGRRDLSVEPRSGLYVLSGVYDVTLENIRAMPWEQGRKPPETPVQHGTYGIGGARWLDCTFRNLTAEGGWISWGVFGTNLNKNFRLEKCALNRIDVHFHCWNLYIRDCTIGFKGISVTGGGDLFVENTTRDGNSFINFRRDYGATWNGPIRLRGCTLRPVSNGGVSVLSLRPANFDYQYQLAVGTSVHIEDLRIDFSAAPESTAPIWLMDTVPFATDPAGRRTVFPQQLTFRDVRVEGRDLGVRLLRIPNPAGYDVGRTGGYDSRGLEANSVLVCERVQLERLTAAQPGDADAVHLLLGGDEPAGEADARSLYPKLVFIDCENVALLLANVAASAFLQRCSINALTARGLRGELSLNECHLRPVVQTAEGALFALESSLPPRFNNCTVHAPVVAGEPAPTLVDRIGILTINEAVRHFHVNTAFGPEVLAWLRAQAIALTPGFVAQLRVSYADEALPEG